MPLRVLQLVLSLAIGGTERLVYDIVHHVNPRRISSIICCLDEFGSFGESLRQEGYQVYALNRSSGIDWRLIHKLHTILQHEQIDVIHAHQYTPYFYGLLASRYSQLRFSQYTPKLIFTEHGRFYPDYRKIKRILANPIFSLFTDEIVTISEKTKQALIRYENFPASRIQVIYNGIELDRFSQPVDRDAKKQELELASAGKVIGIVARLDPIKNHAMLLRAFRQVLEKIPDAYLLIVGDGPEEQRLKTLAQSLNLTDKVKFLGARKDIPELLHTLDVFALSSFSEGTSVTLLEAMAAGLPIVATRVGGTPEVVIDQETGFLVESGDEQGMAAMLITLLQDAQLCQQKGQAGRQRVEAMFTLDHMVNAYTELYCK